MSPDKLNGLYLYIAHEANTEQSVSIFIPKF